MGGSLCTSVSLSIRKIDVFVMKGVNYGSENNNESKYKNRNC